MQIRLLSYLVFYLGIPPVALTPARLCPTDIQAVPYPPFIAAIRLHSFRFEVPRVFLSTLRYQISVP